MEWLLIGLGGSLGAITRYSINIYFRSNKKPIATLLVNMLGSFIFGLILATNLVTNGSFYLFFASGFLGAFTTFSTFTYESLNFFINKGLKKGILYLSFHFSIILLMAIVGFITNSYWF